MRRTISALDIEIETFSKLISWFGSDSHYSTCCGCLISGLTHDLTSGGTWWPLI